MHRVGQRDLCAALGRYVDHAVNKGQISNFFAARCNNSTQTCQFEVPCIRRTCDIVDKP